MLMEMALIQHETSSIPTVTHAYREHNTWADQLTHSDFNGFDLEKRFYPDETHWHIFDQLSTTMTPTTKPPPLGAPMQPPHSGPPANVATTHRPP